MMRSIAAMVCSLVLMVSFAACGGGGDGGGGDTCDYSFSTAMNGPTQETATSFWNCRVEGGFIAYVFASDGTVYTYVSDVEIRDSWTEVGCREVDIFQNESGQTINLTEITGSIESAALTFTESIENGSQYQITCVLNVF